MKLENQVSNQTYSFIQPKNPGNNVSENNGSQNTAAAENVQSTSTTTSTGTNTPPPNSLTNLGSQVASDVNNVLNNPTTTVNNGNVQRAEPLLNNLLTDNANVNSQNNNVSSANQNNNQTNTPTVSREQLIQRFPGRTAEIDNLLNMNISPGFQEQSRPMNDIERNFASNLLMHTPPDNFNNVRDFIRDSVNFRNLSQEPLSQAHLQTISRDQGLLNALGNDRFQGLAGSNVTGNTISQLRTTLNSPEFNTINNLSEQQRQAFYSLQLTGNRQNPPLENSRVINTLNELQANGADFGRVNQLIQNQRARGSENETLAEMGERRSPEQVMMALQSYSTIVSSLNGPNSLPPDSGNRHNVRNLNDAAEGLVNGRIRVNTDPDMNNMEGAYNFRTNTLSLPNTFDFNNTTLRGLVLHELSHAGQDSRGRGQRSNVPAIEAEAYVTQGMYLQLHGEHHPNPVVARAAREVIENGQISPQTNVALEQSIANSPFYSNEMQNRPRLNGL